MNNQEKHVWSNVKKLIIPIVFFLLVLPSVYGQCSALTAGPLHYWKAENNAQDSVGTNHGTNNGATYIDGKIGKSFSFDGSRYITISPSTLARYMDARSICFWARPSRVDLSFTYPPSGSDKYRGGQMIFSYGDQDFTFRVGANGQSLVVGPAKSLPQAIRGPQPLEVPNFWNANEWKHVCVAYKGAGYGGTTTYDVYENGQYLATGSTNLPTNWNSAYIGRHVTGEGYWNGEIDELMYFNKELTSAEVQNVYDSVDCPEPTPAECGNGICNAGETCEQDNCCNGVQCTASQECYQGSCRELCGNGICNAGETCEQDNCCNGVELDLQTDNNNCGSCGNACADGETCEAGICEVIPPVPPAIPSCQLRMECLDGEGSVLRLYEQTNSHASKEGPLKLCCPGFNSACDDNSKVFLRLFSHIDSHVQIPEMTDYGTPVCISADQEVGCYTKRGCEEGETCILRLYQTSDSHVATCDSEEGDYSICCGSPPLPPPPPVVNDNAGIWEEIGAEIADLRICAELTQTEYYTNHLMDDDLGIVGNKFFSCISDDSDVNDCGAAGGCVYDSTCYAYGTKTDIDSDGVNEICYEIYNRQPEPLGQCLDNEISPGETDVDCGGGVCADCENFKACDVNSDCVSGNCYSGTCWPKETCSDGLVGLSTNESDVDCGGYCSRCEDGKSCVYDSDCQSNLCEDYVCSPTGLPPFPTICDDNACSDGETCEEDSCCNGYDVNLDYDFNNCGACGVACSADETCLEGSCVAVQESAICRNCGSGLFNLCDVDECSSIHQNCLFQEGFIIGGQCCADSNGNGICDSVEPTTRAAWKEQIKQPLECTVRSSCDIGEIPVLGLHDLENSLADLPGSGAYYSVCCKGADVLSNIYSDDAEKLIGLQTPEDSLAETPDFTDYPNDATLNGVNPIICERTYESCLDAGYETCVVSLYDNTSSLVAECYSDGAVINVCCSELEPFDTCGNGVCDRTESNLICPLDCKPPGTCGNDVCDEYETPQNCAQDCPAGPTCGDAYCQPEEDAASCPIDCQQEQDGAVCGNNICEVGEDNLICPDDCASGTLCGNNICDSLETAQNCPQDCPTIALCGNGVCEMTETNANCPSDCDPAPSCGNEICEALETTQNCVEDCPADPTCGDGICMPPETAETCSQDCKTDIDYPVCGNEICETGETLNSCPDDCTEPTSCGNGICDPEESLANCPIDCTAVPTGLVLHLPFNELIPDSAPGGADAEDISINDNHGTESGGSTFGLEGHLDKSFGFDGVNDYIDVRDVLDLTDAMSIDVYFKTDQAQDGALVSNWEDQPDNGYMLKMGGDGSELSTSGDKLIFIIADDDVRYIYTTVDPVTDGQWHKAVVTFEDGQDPIIYVDGVVVPVTKTVIDGSDAGRESNPPSVGLTPSYPLRVGAGSSDDHYFSGQIDEVKIWNRVLTPDEAGADCGDNICSIGEDDYCPDDCPINCGNGECEVGEDYLICPADCEQGPVCGDTICSLGEDNLICPEDCGSTDTCGNLYCDPLETVQNCPQDCPLPPTCGNDVCDRLETNIDCPDDCTVSETCGDEVCDDTETQQNCAEDCSTPAACGDGVCEPFETPATCSLDCGSSDNPACNDGVCDIEETINSCPEDCTPPGTCDGGTCDAGETPQNCPTDCVPSAVCGNNKCEAGEDNLNCEIDCPVVPFCGNDICNQGENNVNCPADCSSGGTCGNNVCDDLETVQNCAQDCPAQSTCGNGICDRGENNIICSFDCAPTTTCGNEICDLFETEMNCVQDCPPLPECGDGNCASPETPPACAQDCVDPNSPACGNGVCEAGETSNNCANDCPKPDSCDGGACDSGENSMTCPSDCPTTSDCGNGECDEGEDETNCAEDCEPVPYCGNNICEGGEHSLNCPGDCSAPNSCGNGQCDALETAQNCPIECPISLQLTKRLCQQIESNFWLRYHRITDEGQFNNNYFACQPYDLDTSFCLNGCVYNGICYAYGEMADLDGDTIMEICNAPGTIPRFFKPADLEVPPEEPIDPCEDGELGIDETDVDCGGACGPCGLGQHCIIDTDCHTNFCSPTSSSCEVESCSDTVKNQNEADVDCGGICPPCDIGMSCRTPVDCATGLCEGEVCIARSIMINPEAGQSCSEACLVHGYCESAIVASGTPPAYLRKSCTEAIGETATCYCIVE